MGIRKTVSLFLAFAAFAFCPASALAEDWKASLSTTYEEGKYGTGSMVETLYVPITVKRNFDMGDISLTVPYVVQRSAGQVIFVGGTVFRKNGGSAAVATNSGIGDVILKGTLYLLREYKKQPLDVSLAANIKFPTADEGTGLGTGEFDETAGLEFSKILYPAWTGFFDFYHTLVGKPAGSGFKDKFSFDLGVAKKITPELTGSVFYKESTPLVRGELDRREILVYVEYRMTKEIALTAGVDVGLTASSPDYGITAGVSHKF
ncbi:MAG: transporter [Deltaproteobacteria bacterium]|nr:transporter [Deltaproteobacteria bacterium]